MPLRIQDYIASFPLRFPFLDSAIEPWKLTTDVAHVVERFATSLDLSGFQKAAGIWVHEEATVERGAIIKPPAMISAACFIASTAYLRGGVVLDHGVTIGPACELKSTIVMASSRLAHLSFVGDWEGIRTGVAKFGAVIGDHSRVGANAVLLPGTVLPPHSVVARLGLVDQR